MCKRGQSAEGILFWYLGLYILGLRNNDIITYYVVYRRICESATEWIDNGYHDNYI